MYNYMSHHVIWKSVDQYKFLAIKISNLNQTSIKKYMTGFTKSEAQSARDLYFMHTMMYKE